MSSKKTKRLYYDDPYKTEFEAKIISADCVDDCKWNIILDQTLFYPESGGQSSDRGVLGGVHVLNVFEVEEVIIHVLDRELEKGKIVHGYIDWDRRFDHMQQHSGQHILSQCFSKLKGGRTIGFHLGRCYSTIDIDISNLSEKDLRNIENLANQIVLENRDIVIKVIDKDELENITLRKYPQGKDRLRTVEIKDFEWTACCGTHVKKTGEIGIIKIINTENYKGGKRVIFKCGWRSIKDYQSKNIILKNAANLLTSSELDLVDNIEKIMNKQNIQKRRIKKFLKGIIDVESKELLNDAKLINGIKTIVKVFTNRESDEISILLKKLISTEKIVVIIGLKKQEPMLFMGRSKDMDLDLQKIMEHASNIIKGKGGGSPFFAQAKGEIENKIEEAVKEARTMVEHNIQLLDE